MKLLKTDVTKFQTLYKTKFGVELDRKTAYKKLSLLVLQMGTIYTPISKERFEMFMKNEDEKRNDHDNTVATMAN